ncbi:MAG TPA: aldo/keto reductase [Verrucomicrobiales bacterium]|nr:aldo/keto reductase [Verrucomicrobiae bacterium]MCP5555299.1 aldo/keto reductase [Akkermansiaceae bacterium]HRX56652.1 aldo/keto reductase [Verrucomicrobiales bacterium]
MDLTRTAYGTWSGGRFMHFGEQLDEDRFTRLIQHAYDQGIRTFVTADVYGVGRADEFIGNALSGIDRSTYCLVGTIGHDFYTGQRRGSSGYPRFTDPALRGESDYADYLRMATEKSLERCQTDHFDLIMLHNPDSIGYSSEKVWDGMRALRDTGLTEMTGVAPGPANGFAIDLAYCFEHFQEVMDWAMIILNPNEPWPGRCVLGPAKEFGVKVLTRVVDYGGLFHDDVKPGHTFREGDHRTYRPAGWVEHGVEKIEKMRQVADRHGLTLLQFACQWNLAQEPVQCVVPTFIQEAGENTKAVEDKVTEMAQLPEENRLSPEEVEAVYHIGNNVGCMELKGASTRHEGLDPQPDHWPLRPELAEVAQRWAIDPAW